MNDFKEGIDIEDGLKRLKGNKVLYKKLLNIFFNGDLLQQLVESIERSDAPAARIHAHSIKGAAANLSLNKISATAAAIDSLLKVNGTVITHECLDLLHELEKLSSLTKEWLNKLEL